MTDKSVGTLKVVSKANINDTTTNNDKIISSIFYIKKANKCTSSNIIT